MTEGEANHSWATANRPMPSLETERLTLRPFELTDAGEVQRLAGDPAVADTTLNIPHPYEDGDAENWISTHRPKFEAGEFVTLAMVLRDSRALVGAISLHRAKRFDRAELGYWVAKPYWNQGYCTEAARAIIKYGFEEMKLNRIYANYFSRNAASGRIMEKAWMTREGVMRQHVKKNGKYEDLVNYALLREDWERRGGPHPG